MRLIVLCMLPLVLCDSSEELSGLVTVVKSSLQEQTDKVKSITERSDDMITDGTKYLKDFGNNLKSLYPFLRHESTVPFLRIIQEFIDTKTGLRREISNAIDTTKLELKRAKKEFSSSDKLFKRIMATVNLGNKPDTGRAAGTTYMPKDRIVELIKPHVKSITMASGRINEIDDKLITLQKEMKSKNLRLDASSKLLLNYRFLLELVIKSREQTVNSKNTLMSSINMKDKVTYNFNRLKSLLEKGKVLIEESNKKELYTIEKQKLTQLQTKINIDKRELCKMNNKVMKEIEYMKSLLLKSEEYEKIIKQVGEKNIKSPDSAYKKSQHYYQLIVILGNKIQEMGNKIKLLKLKSTEMLQNSSTMFGEMENVMKRKNTLGARKPKINEIRIKKRSTKGKDLDNVGIASDTDEQSDTESDSESDQISTESSSSSSNSVGKVRNKKRRTRQSLDNSRGSSSSSGTESSAPPVRPLRRRKANTPSGSGSSSASASGSAGESVSGSVSGSVGESAGGSVAQSTNPFAVSFNPNNPFNTGEISSESSNSSESSSESSSSESESESDGYDTADSEDESTPILPLRRRRTRSRDTASASSHPATKVESPESSNTQSEQSVQSVQSERVKSEQSEKVKRGIKSKIGKALGFIRDVITTPINPRRDQTSWESAGTESTRAESTGSDSEESDDDEDEIVTRRSPIPGNHSSSNSFAGPYPRFNPSTSGTSGSASRSATIGMIRGTLGEVESELNSRFIGLRLDGSRRSEAIKLVGLAYELKNQFEIVTKNLDKSVAESAVRIIKTVLMDVLHTYLTGVCAKVLNITDLRLYN
ncbi:hypothetical protein TpMuguga_01g00561 [Theileria parva strain Muguga]|uniref:Uncharacterized protein n=1 Tax=Theileria parva TaxID=5875 RepID=Q4N8B1_THEPA|nr:uncharacterized protein TpMuguga_01g00561 [Theileria parva strain Muguga]EAN33797.1 hypothetical protein TpMuguga_01g00561 [Theileria parva strain Muguga]|eukprot:XP_766080.1 hypothetical protein [Theileria parva strain Muguga]